MNCLTPLELPSLLQNLMVSLASWGINRPRPFFRGALLLIQPDLRNIHLLLMADAVATVVWCGLVWSGDSLKDNKVTAQLAVQ